jgi:hypothetical protein
MLGDGVYFDSAQQIENTQGGKFLLIDDDSSALKAYSSSLRREGHEVRAFASFSEGLSCLESEHFDLVMVKLREVSSLNDERFWTVESRFPAGSLACYWHAVSIGLVTWMWRTWDHWSN